MGLPVLVLREWPWWAPEDRWHVEDGEKGGGVQFSCIINGYFGDQRSVFYHTVLYMYIIPLLSSSTVVGILLGFPTTTITFTYQKILHLSHSEFFLEF